MQIVCLVAWVMVVVDATHQAESRNDTALTFKLRALLSTKANKWNRTGLWLGFVNQNEKIELASGVVDGVTHEGQRATTANLVPLGSITKTYTAAAIMGQVERGLVNLDDPMAQHVDPVLSKWNGTTLGQLFGADSGIYNVTVRHLLSMHSGLHDYNDKSYEDESLRNPTRDIGPFELIHAMRKSLIYPPGTTGSYSSMNFVFLGLILAKGENVSSWDAYNQRHVFPESVAPNYQHTDFVLHGPCSDITQVHQYARVNTTWNWTADKVINPGNITDVFNVSCLNGWTM
jgi:CubicO group peptidase (beta-lactamase class C family)